MHVVLIRDGLSHLDEREFKEVGNGKGKGITISTSGKMRCSGTCVAMSW